jgi:hypothetical protein
MPRALESVRSLERAWFHAPVGRFLGMPDAEIVGHLTVSGPHSVDPAPAEARTAEIVIPKNALHGLSGHLLLEFDIPRMGRRIDAVLIVGHLIVVIEFKVGSDVFDRSAIERVWDYSLDLKNFHGVSHAVPIVPLLVAMRTTQLAQPTSFMRPPVRCGRTIAAGARKTSMRRNRPRRARGSSHGAGRLCNLRPMTPRDSVAPQRG